MTRQRLMDIEQARIDLVEASSELVAAMKDGARKEREAMKHLHDIAMDQCRGRLRRCAGTAGVDGGLPWWGWVLVAGVLAGGAAAGASL